MKKVALILAPIVLSLSLIGCANKDQQESYSLTKAASTLANSDTTSASTTSINDMWKETKTEVSNKIPEQIKKAASDFKKEAPVAYNKAVANMTTASKEAAKAMDDNFNAIFN